MLTSKLNAMENRGKNIWGLFALTALTLSVFAMDIVPSSKSMAKELEKRQIRKTVVAGANYFAGENVSCCSIEDLPQRVKSAVIGKYVAYSIDRIFRESNDVFKIVLKNQYSRLNTYYSGEGEFLKQDVVEPVRMVELLH